MWRTDGWTHNDSIYHASIASCGKNHMTKFHQSFSICCLLKYHNLFTHSYNIIFCWLPSHVGITGNEKADKAAKSALNKWIIRIPIPYTDLKPIINKYIHNKWPQSWNLQTQNKLYQIYPYISAVRHRPLASTHSTVPQRVECWVDLSGWLHTEIKCCLRESNPDTVTLPSTNRAQRRLTTLI